MICPVVRKNSRTPILASADRRSSLFMRPSMSVREQIRDGMTRAGSEMGAGITIEAHESRYAQLAHRDRATLLRGAIE